MSAVYENLLLKLLNVMELTLQSQHATGPQMKQSLLQATNDFRDSLRQAKEIANTLPGGDLSIQQQDEIIEMLEQLKARKQQQLAAFSDRMDSVATAVADEFKAENMDVDSTASTPS